MCACVCSFGVRVCANVMAGYAGSCHWHRGGGNVLTCYFKAKKYHMKHIIFKCLYT